MLEERRLFKPQQPSNILTGLLFDGWGRRMHARAGKNNFGAFRYYASAPVAWATRQNLKPFRARADDLEQLVLETIRSFLTDRRDVRGVLMEAGIFAPELERLASAASEAAVRIGRLSVRRTSCLLKSILQCVEIHPEFVRLVLRVEALPAFLAWDGVGLFALGELDLARARQVHRIDVAAHVNRERSGHCLPLSPRPGEPARADPKLISLLDDAREAQRLVFENRDIAVAHLAWSLGRRPASFGRLVRLNYLAPDITAAILDGDQPAGLSRKTLMQTDLPTDWALQRRLLGFAPVPC